MPFQGVTLPQFKDAFVEETVQVLRFMSEQKNAAAVEDHLRRQLTYINQEVTWSVRTRQWSDWLGSVVS